MYKKYIKRLIDIILSLLLIIILLPLIILISIIEIFNIGFPIIFKQSREGKNKMPFNIYKFRTGAPIVIIIIIEPITLINKKEKSPCPNTL